VEGFESYDDQVAWLGKAADFLDGKSVLITGATGSFGKAFLHRLLCSGDYKPRRVIVFSRDELKQSEMQVKFNEKTYPQLRYFLGDVRDHPRLLEALNGVDTVVHAAALKQVPALEFNPQEAIKTNVNGAMNLINACLERKVKHVVALSTDKAATPINLYGATKLASDKLFVAANTLGGQTTKFCVVRYGNVFGSRGSIVPVFHKMKNNGVVTITESDMTRFTITLEQAVNFVLTCLAVTQGGEVYVPKIPSYRIGTIATAIAPDCEHKHIGRRPGEKLHEVMVPEDDSYRTTEIPDRYVIEPDWAQEFVANGTRKTVGTPVPLGFSYDSGNNTDWVNVQDLRLLYIDWAKELLDVDIPPLDASVGADVAIKPEYKMGVVEMSTLKVQEGKIDEFTAATRRYQTMTQMEQDNLRCDFLANPAAPGTFMLYKGFSSAAAAEAHTTTLHFNDWQATCEACLAEPATSMAMEDQK